MQAWHGRRVHSPKEVSMKITLTPVAALAVLAVTAGCAAAAPAPALPPPVPAHFAPEVDNPWFPLRPGAVYEYRGVEDGQAAHQLFTVTRRTKVIQGVRCTVIRDLVYKRGRLAERTEDWYAQDAKGNVWYFGEATATLDRRGHVKSREGAWQAGVDGARAGIYMPAHPRVGTTGRQEYLRGHAEDEFTVVSLSARVRTPFVASRRALQTREFSPLEPGVLDRKLYVRGVGQVLEASVRGGNDRLALVAVRRR
jgi:hypothetical protein